jgi:exopolysaccharide biosynthesis polyprenyl glycosylphosphotransferase
VGAGKLGYKLDAILAKQHQDLRVRGFIDDYKDGAKVLGKVKDLPRVLQRHFIDEVFITIPSERGLVKRVASHAFRFGVNVSVIPELFDGIMPLKTQSFEFFGDLPVMELYRKPIPELGLIFKRVMDITGSLLGIFLLSPIMLVIAIAIKIDSPEGAVIYRSRRIGRKGQRFDCYKFRTMVPDADALKDSLRHLNERNGPFFKITDDPRFIRVGKFLRKYSMDEFPQFFNVLKGDMSLVGPRPHPLDDFRLYNLHHYRRLDVKPGLTSLWAVEARCDPSFERNMELDLSYIENWNQWLDIRILLRTIPAVLRGMGK